MSTVRIKWISPHLKHREIHPGKNSLRTKTKEVKASCNVSCKLEVDLVGPKYGQRTAIAVLWLCWRWRTQPVVASLPSTVRGRQSLAIILQVALMLHLPPHGGVPVVLDGVVRPVREKIRFFKIKTHLHHQSN